MPRPPATRAFDRFLRPDPAWWRDFERTWLGPTHEPFAQRAAEVGWSPDGPSEYCPRCASTVGPHEVAVVDERRGTVACTDCRGRRLPWARAVRLGPYTGLLREAIHEAKFTRFRAVAAGLGHLLGVQLAARLDAAGVDRDGLVLVPIPMSARRRMARGIDHTLVIARAARRITGGRIVRPVRRLHRLSQLDVPPSRRRSNVSGSFRPAGLIRGSRRAAGTIVLIDDVRTTGATLSEATRVVRRAYSGGLGGPGGGWAAVEVWVAVLAVTPRPEEREVHRSSTVDPPRGAV